MRYLKFIAAVNLFLLALPEQALANLAPSPPIHVMWQLLFILPLIIIFTEIGGGYPILKSIRDNSWKKHIKYLTGIGGPLIAVFAVYSAAVTGFGFPIFLIFAIYAVFRGTHLIQWGFAAGGKSPAAIYHIKNARPWRLKLGGSLLVVSTLLLVILPLTFNTPLRYNPSPFDTESNLHNLFLGCKAYWADNKPSDICSVDIASQTTYGYIQSPSVIITASGDEAHFSAIASHLDDDKTFAIDSNGVISEPSAPLSIGSRRNDSEAGWLKDPVANVKKELRRLGIQ